LRGNTYSPYGDRTVLDNTGTELTSASTDYGFTGRRFDAETGMWYFRARYFDSDMGRFISRDPLGYVDGYGLYNGYFGLHFGVDPSGLKYNKDKPMPTSGAEPKYEPKKWNKDPYQKGNNCYAYGCNDLDKKRKNKDDQPQPGGGGTSPKAKGQYTCKSVTDAVIAQLGGDIKTATADKACGQGCYKIALVVGDLMVLYKKGEKLKGPYTDIVGYDYHWYRQDSGGAWSHKGGTGPATNKDGANKDIWDPQTANRTSILSIGPSSRNKDVQKIDYINYNKFCGFFCIKNGVSL
jgi:RHS repeat-associated protein